MTPMGQGTKRPAAALDYDTLGQTLVDSMLRGQQLQQGQLQQGQMQMQMQPQFTTANQQQLLQRLMAQGPEGLSQMLPPTMRHGR